MQHQKRLVFATNNPNKVKEIFHALAGAWEVQTLESIACKEELPETGNTLGANALQKARFVYDNYKANCFADDTGLEVEALNGAPGVYSARYAGEQKNAGDNCMKLLKEMASVSNRKARFRTVIALIIDGREHLFEGIVEGRINTELRGSNGFGYDPLFIPEGSQKTFAEMDLIEKNRISHRARAVNKLVDFLNSL
jgi:XTP/dITP diphosphohydrolase